MSVATLLRGFLGGDLPVRIQAYDGSALGPAEARTVLQIRSPDAIRRVLTRPGELGIAPSSRQASHKHRETTAAPRLPCR